MASFLRSHVMARALSALGAPPATSPDWVTAVMKQAGQWFMFGNDRYGDCVCADCGHAEMLRTANVGQIWVPSIDQVLALYAYFQGYDGPDELDHIEDYLANNDNGCNELDVITYLTKTGWNGRKLDGSANLDPTQLDQIKWAVCIFGASRLGVNLPDSAQAQFASSQPWTPVSDAQLDGGHDVPVVGYDASYFYVVTWGKLQPVSLSFMTAKYSDGTPYVEEAHAELAFDWVNQAGTCPANLNLTQLMADLSAIVEPEPQPSPVPPSPVPAPPGPPPSPTTMSKGEFRTLVSTSIDFDYLDDKVGVKQMAGNVDEICKQVMK